MRPGLSYSAEKSQVTPIGSICGMNPPIRRNLNSNGRRMNEMGSDLLKGTESLRELRRKRQIESKGIENNALLSSSLVEKKVWSETNKARQIEQWPCRITRSGKSVNSVEKSFTGNRINWDQGKEPRESSNKLKMWLR